jgi:excisionase family DNA binding protein
MEVLVIFSRISMEDSRSMTEWMTQDEAAEWLRISSAELAAAVASGELPALRVAGKVRISRSRLLGMTNLASSGPIEVEPEDVVAEGVPPPVGFTWLEDLQPTAAFDHVWPKRGGGGFEEHYPTAWAGLANINGTQVEVIIGETTRYERGRLSVFFDGYPVAEFMDTPDGSGWASVIKPDGKKTVSASSDLPPLYRAVKVASYREATGTSGSGRPKGLAVVIPRNDLRSAAHHAAARQAGKSGQPVSGPPSYFWIEVEMHVPHAVAAGTQEAMRSSIAGAYNSQMLRPSEVGWADGRTATVRMAAGGISRKDAERAVIQMVQRHAEVADIAPGHALTLRVCSSATFDPLEYRRTQRG